MFFLGNLFLYLARLANFSTGLYILPSVISSFFTMSKAISVGLHARLCHTFLVRCVLTPGQTHVAFFNHSTLYCRHMGYRNYC